jgi:TatD DNase family protein
MYALIDSHCHLDFDVFDEDRNEVVSRAKNNGITDIIIPGVSSNNWSTIKSICSNNPHIHPCYGLHPYLADQHTNDDISNLIQWVNQNHCVAIGECGLDYRKGQAEKETQMKFFELQLDIAINADLPVVIHSVRATEDVIKTVLKKPGLRGMIHGYSGSYEQAMLLTEHGFFISLGGAVSYDHARKIRSVASRLPAFSLLLETDAPDQPDAKHKGQRNEPSYLVSVLECLSELRGESKEKIAEQTSINARRLFQI